MNNYQPPSVRKAKELVKAAIYLLLGTTALIMYYAIIVLTASAYRMEGAASTLDGVLFGRQGNKAAMDSCYRAANRLYDKADKTLRWAFITPPTTSRAPAKQSEK